MNIHLEVLSGPYFFKGCLGVYTWYWLQLRLVYCSANGWSKEIICFGIIKDYIFISHKCEHGVCDWLKVRVCINVHTYTVIMSCVHVS